MNTTTFEWSCLSAHQTRIINEMEQDTSLSDENSIVVIFIFMFICFFPVLWIAFSLLCQAVENKLLPPVIV